MLKLTAFLFFWLLLLISLSVASDHDLTARERFQTIKAAFDELGHRVRTTVLAQVGDTARIELQRNSASHFLDMLHRQQDTIPPADFGIMTSSVEQMLEALTYVAEQSRDSTVPSVETSHLVYTGLPGRPRREINPEYLEVGLNLRGPRGLAPIFDCSARTVRRRAIEYGLAEACPPVYVEYEDEETGQWVRLYHPESEEDTPESLSDDMLDSVLRHILKIFPSFGRRMITGHLRFLGHHIPREHVRASYERVQGAPAVLISRSITRRTYRVAGPNALWHHDGQHALIHYRVVIHAFVDGFSRMVTGIRASNNNRAETVLDLFNEARTAHGTPSRVRGDHGVENLDVAEFMETSFGVARGSYIWGRSVHNVRIERLWRDVTRGFGKKWKEFFQQLEVDGDLRPDWSSHVWLLHHLFLPHINEDAMEWAETWNRHNLRQATERERSPRDMFFFGQLQNGWRDMSDRVQSPPDEEIEDIATYGIDWEDLEDRDILRHHNTHNDASTLIEALPASAPQGNTEIPSRRPPHLSLIEVPDADCPLTNQEVEMLHEHLIQLPEIHSRGMRDRRTLWIQALAFVRYLAGES